MRKVSLRCGDRTCGVCRGKDYIRLVKGYQDSVRAMKSPKLLTLTLKNRPELLAGDVRACRRLFVRMMRRQFFKARVRGGLAVVEVTNKGTGWHIHLHVLLDSEYLPHDLLRRSWFSLTGDSYIVDIREAHTVGEGLKYILKYLAKPPTLQGKREVLAPGELEARREEYRLALKGVRLVQPFGSLYADLVCELPQVVCECGSTRWIIWEWDLAWQWNAWRNERSP